MVELKVTKVAKLKYYKGSKMQVMEDVTSTQVTEATKTEFLIKGYGGNKVCDGANLESKLGESQRTILKLC